MKFTKDAYNWFVCLERGEELVSSLESLVSQEAIDGAWLSIIGAAEKVELGFYNLPTKKYQWQSFDELMEITGLEGNISWLEDSPKLHLHGTFSRADYSTVGGHVKSLIVGGTAEIFIHRWYGSQLTRSQDKSTGLSLLNL